VTRPDAGLRTSEQPRGVPTIPARSGEGPDLAQAAQVEAVGSSDRDLAGAAGYDVPGARPDAPADTRRIEGPADVDGTANGVEEVAALEIVQTPEVVDDRHAAAPVRRAFAPPAQGGSGTVWVLAAGLLTLLLMVAGVSFQRAGFRPSVPSLVREVSIAAFAGLQRSRSDPGIAARSRGPGRAPRAAPLVPPATRRRRGAERGVRPAAAPPFPAAVAPPAAAPPSRVAGGAVLVAAPESVLPAPTSWVGTVSVEARRVRAARAAQLAASEVTTEARIAGSCLPAMPTVIAVALLLLGAVSPVSVVDGAALVAAVTLTVAGVRWTWRLPTTPSRAFAGVERRLDREQRYLEVVLDALQTAELHAVAGLDGDAALDAAVDGDAAHPLQRVRTAPVGRALARPSGECSPLVAWLRAAEVASGAGAVDVLSRCEAWLRDQHLGEVYRRRLQLVRVRAVGPFLACALPATALVVVALST
jgi:hypothetical protein